MRVEEIPENMKELAEEYRIKLLEAVSDFDDEIMENYLEGNEISTDAIKAAIRKATVAVEMIPVTCGTSYRNKGVQKLLDAIVDYMPSPLDIPAITGINPKTEEEEIQGIYGLDVESIPTHKPMIRKDENLSLIHIWGEELERGKGVFNGELGVITSIQLEAEMFTVQFDDDRVSEYDFAQADEVTLSYAISIHKSQGSEFDRVAIALLGGTPMLYNRNLLYLSLIHI